MKFAPPEIIAAESEWRRRHPEQTGSPLTTAGLSDSYRAEYVAILGAAESGQKDLAAVTASGLAGEAVALVSTLVDGISDWREWRVEQYVQVKPAVAPLRPLDVDALAATLPPPQLGPRTEELAMQASRGSLKFLNQDKLGSAAEIVNAVKTYLGPLPARVVLSNVIGFRNLLIAKNAPQKTIDLFNTAVAETAMWYHHFFEGSEF